MDPEAIDDDVPEGMEIADHQGLAKWNPDVIDNEEAAMKVTRLEIGGLTYRLSMLGEALPESPAAVTGCNGTFSSAGNVSLADIDWQPALKVSYGPVEFERSGVVDGVDTGTGEADQAIEWNRVLNEQGILDAASKIAPVKGIVRRLATRHRLIDP